MVMQRNICMHPLDQEFITDIHATPRRKAKPYAMRCITPFFLRWGNGERLSNILPYATLQRIRRASEDMIETPWIEGESLVLHTVTDKPSDKAFASSINST